MMTADLDNMLDLVTSLEAWGIPDWIARMDSTDLLVIDPPLHTALEEYLEKPLGCHSMTPAEALASRKALRYRRILVFTLDHEMLVTRRIRSRLGDWKSVFSLQYDLGPGGSMRPLRFRPLTQPLADLGEPPVVILSSPGSDAEYLADVMEATGMGPSPEFFGGPVTALLPHLKDRFQPLRFLTAAVNRYPVVGPFSMLVQTDVLDALYQSRALTPERFQSWLTSTNAKVIYFVRRDKLMQAGLLGALSHTPYRSVWRLRPNVRRRYFEQPFDFAATNRRLNRLMEMEAELEAQIIENEGVKMITLEDLVAKPLEVMEDIGRFLGRKLTEGVTMPAYYPVYRSMPALLRTIVAFRLELIDRLGLHINEAGSLVGQSERLLKNARVAGVDAALQARREDRKEKRTAARARGIRTARDGQRRQRQRKDRDDD